MAKGWLLLRFVCILILTLSMVTALPDWIPQNANVRGFYKFENNMIDENGLRNCTNQGGIFVTGQDGFGIDFDGSSSWAYCPYDLILLEDVSGNEERFAIAFWMRVDEYDGTTNTVFGGDPSAGNPTIVIRITNKSHMDFIDNPENIVVIDPDADVGEWHHYMWVIDDQTNEYFVYLDGVKVFEELSDDSEIQGGGQSAQGLGAGESRFSGISPVNYADVTLDELVVWGGIGASFDDGGCLVGEFCNESSIGQIMNYNFPLPAITGYVAEYQFNNMDDVVVNGIVIFLITLATLTPMIAIVLLYRWSKKKVE